MGTMAGHILSGFGFLLFGLWHLLNHIKLHALHPKTYTTLPWFPTSKIRHLEIFLIIGGCIASISMELFLGTKNHQPLDIDGTIPTVNLHNFEHSTISLTMLVSSFLMMILDLIQPPAQYALTQMLVAISFAQELFFLQVHSNDHNALEGHYHWILQIVISLTVFTTLFSIGYPKSFLNNFVRSLSILFQGVWMISMGVLLWTPEFVPKGCFLKLEFHYIVRCHSPEALERAKSLVNLLFGWYIIGFIFFSILLYLALIKIYPEKVEYEFVTTFEEKDDDLTAQKGKNQGELNGFLQPGKFFAHQNLPSKD